jgi:hypothetical protein
MKMMRLEIDGQLSRLHLAPGRLWGSRLARERPGSPGSDGASPYRSN